MGRDELENLVRAALEAATERGVDQAEVVTSIDTGLAATARLGPATTVQHAVVASGASGRPPSTSPARASHDPVSMSINRQESSTRGRASTLSRSRDASGASTEVRRAADRDVARAP